MTRLRKGNRRRRAPQGLPRAARLRIWAIALLLGAAAGYWGRGSAFDAAAPDGFQVAHVSVSGNVRTSAAEIVARAGIGAGLQLRSEDLERIRAAIRSHPWVREARIARLPPDRIVVAVEERQPVAVAWLDDSVRFVDAQGVPFAEAPVHAQGPQILGVRTASPDAPHPLLAQAVRLIEASAGEGLPVPARIHVGGRAAEELPALTWQRAGGAALTAILGGELLEARLARLAHVWMADPPELRAAQEIDLRFGEQLILRGVAEVAPQEEPEPREESQTSNPNEPGRSATADVRVHSQKG